MAALTSTTPLTAMPVMVTVAGVGVGVGVGAGDPPPPHAPNTNVNARVALVAALWKEFLLSIVILLDAAVNAGNRVRWIAGSLCRRKLLVIEM
jgi:hypothetical protein